MSGESDYNAFFFFGIAIVLPPQHLIYFVNIKRPIALLHFVRNNIPEFSDKNAFLVGMKKKQNP